MTKTYDVFRPDVDKHTPCSSLKECIQHLTTFKGPAIIFSPDGTRIVSRGDVPPSKGEGFDPSRRNSN